jgi:solute carrier family 25 (adenine nucleotide translocator) protein 4/5/6/31
MPMKNQYKRMLIDPERPMNIYGVSWYATNIVAGALAGATWIALTYPAHQARMILANDFLQSTRTGEAHRYEKRTLREIVAKDGVQVLYQRFGLACAGVAVYRGLFFGLYDSLKPFARKESFISNFFLGWGTSMSAHIATYPLDILRRYAEKTKSKSAVHAIMAMMRNGELNALFRGVTGGLVRASSGGGVLAGYDLIMSLLFPKY